MLFLVVSMDIGDGFWGCFRIILKGWVVVFLGFIRGGSSSF